MTDSAYFLDTYALAKFNTGDTAYKPYENVDGILTIFNLAELNWSFKRDNKLAADKLTRHYAANQVPVLVEDIISAMNLRLQNKKLSIPDVIGYIVAQRHGIKFLTGDKEFEGMKNVEFVK